MTIDQQVQFLEELGVSGSVTFACMAADVTREQAYDAREESPRFEAMWREAAAIATNRVNRRIDAHRRMEESTR